MACVRFGQRMHKVINFTRSSVVAKVSIDFAKLLNEILTKLTSDSMNASVLRTWAAV